MAGINSLLDISKRALNAQTEAMRVLSNNVANVNTEGYSRRRAEFVSTTSSDADTSAFGNGVEINKVTRIVDAFINSELNVRTSERAKAEIRDELLNRAETPFSVDSTIRHIGAEISKFFSALEDLSTNPSNIPLRQQVIEQGNALTQSIQSSFDIVADLQREADTRTGLYISDINRITGEIANLNELIQAAETGQQQDLTLRDQRDLLIRELSNKISFDSVEDSSGNIQIYLSNGFSLVNGSTARALEFTYSPSFNLAPPDQYPSGMDGAPLGHVVFDFDTTAGTAHMDLTQVLAAGGGEVAGLLSLRGTMTTSFMGGPYSPFDYNGELVEIGSRLEAITRDLLFRFNAVYLGADEDPTPAPPIGDHDPSSVDLNGNTAPSDTTPNSPFQLFNATGVQDSFDNNIADQFDGVNDPTIFARTITFNITDPNLIQASADLDPTNAGSIVGAPGDATIINALIGLRSQAFDFGVYGTNYSRVTTLEGVYEETVAFTGGITQRNRDNLFIFRDREQQTEELQASQSGVSLDEEFAKLINFQRGFESAARMIRVGDELLSEIINLFG